MRPLGIVHVASEMAPLAKVGGLGDVVAALAREQSVRGHRVLVVLPGYRDLALPADIDVDGDGKAESVSGALRWTAIPARITGYSPAN